MSRQTELSAIYNELASIQSYMLLVGTYDAGREITRAMELIYEQYRKEVEAAARMQGGAG